MALRALRFIGGVDNASPARSELTDELIRSFAKTRLQAEPGAYVVLNSELPGFLRFGDLMIDRGRKHQAKPLAKLLLGHSKIPFINGSYESAGQLVRSVRTLLENAFAKDDHNIYIIGTTEKILSELWEKAGSAQPSEMAASKPRAGRPAQNPGSRARCRANYSCSFFLAARYRKISCRPLLAHPLKSNWSANS